MRSARLSARSSNVPQGSLVESLEARQFLSVSIGYTGSTGGTGGSIGGSGGGTVIVVPPTVSNGTPIPSTIRTAAGRTYLGVVGGIKNVSAPGMKVFASIDWGDGTNPTPAIVVKQAAGKYQFSGKHAYKFGGTYSITISPWATPIAPPGGVVPAIALILSEVVSQAIITGPAAPKLISPQPVALKLTAEKSFSGKVAGFRLSAPLTGPGVLSAGIDWGDGGFSAGTLTKNADGLYTVTGSHTYLLAGTYAINVSISQGPPIGPGPVPLYPTRLLGSITSSAIVTPPPPFGPDGSATLVGGVLKIVGTSQADVIDVTQTSPFIIVPYTDSPTAGGSGSAGGSSGGTGGGVIIDPPPPATSNIIVKINGHVHQFVASAVKSVTVNGLAGDDKINLHGSNFPEIIPLATTNALFPLFNDGLKVAAIIHGGDGNDTLTSSAGNDKAYGGDGDDTAILAVKPTVVGPFPQVYNFGFIASDVEHVLAPPVVKA